MLDQIKPQLEDFTRKYGLSRRETDVFKELISGKTSGKELSDALGISPNTVRIHLKNINLRVGVASKTTVISSFLNHLVKHPTQLNSLRSEYPMTPAPNDMTSTRESTPSFL